MTQVQKSWIDYIKRNLIALIPIVGSVLYFAHVVDRHFFKIETNQAETKVWQEKSDKNYTELSIGFDTLKGQMRQMKQEMNLRFQMQDIKFKSGGFVTERKDRNGLHVESVN